MRKRIALAALAVFAASLKAAPQTSTSGQLTVTAQLQDYVIINLSPTTLTCPLTVANLNQNVYCGQANGSWQYRCTNGAVHGGSVSPPTPANITCPGYDSLGSLTTPPGTFGGPIGPIDCYAFHDPNLSGTYTKTITFTLACL